MEDDPYLQPTYVRNKLSAHLGYLPGYNSYTPKVGCFRCITVGVELSRYRGNFAYGIKLAHRHVGR